MAPQWRPPIPDETRLIVDATVADTPREGPVNPTPLRKIHGAPALRTF